MLGSNNELKNRFLHIDFESATQSANSMAPKCKNCTLEEIAIINALRENPKITQKELAIIIGKSDRTVKRDIWILCRKKVSSKEKTASVMVNGKF